MLSIEYFGIACKTYGNNKNDNRQKANQYHHRRKSFAVEHQHKSQEYQCRPRLFLQQYDTHRQGYYKYGYQYFSSDRNSMKIL